MPLRHGLYCMWAFMPTHVGSHIVTGRKDSDHHMTRGDNMYSAYTCTSEPCCGTLELLSAKGIVPCCQWGMWIIQPYRERRAVVEFLTFEKPQKKRLISVDLAGRYNIILWWTSKINICMVQEVSEKICLFVCLCNSDQPFIIQTWHSMPTCFQSMALIQLPLLKARSV